MASLAEVNFKISANTSEFQTAMRKATKSFQSFGDNLKKFGSTMTMGFTAPIVALGAGSLKIAGSVEQTQKTFEVLLKSVDGAKTMISDLQKFSAETPFEFMQTKDFATSLLAVGVATKDIIPTLTHLGDLSMGNADKFQRLSEAFTKVKSKGRASMEELNRFTEAGVPIIAALADKFKITTAEVFKLCEKGKIGFGDLNEAIIKLTTNGGKFAGIMQAQNTSIIGLFSNFMDSVSQSMAKFGMAISKALDLKDLIPKISGWIQGLGDAFSNLNPSTQKFIVIAAGVVAAVGPILLAIGFLTANIIPALIAGVGAVIGAMGGLSAAFAATSAVLAANPWGAVVVAIGLAYGAMMLFSNSQKESIISSGAFMASLLSETATLRQLFAQTKLATAGSASRKNGIDEINKVYGAYLPKLLTEKSSLEEIARAQKIATGALMANIAAKAKEGDIKRAIEKNAGKFETNLSKIKEWTPGDESKKANAQGEVTDFIVKNRTITDSQGGNTEFNKRLVSNFSKDLAKKYGANPNVAIGFSNQINDIINSQLALDASTKQISTYYDRLIGKLNPVGKAIEEVTGATDEETKATEAKAAAAKRAAQGFGILADKEREIQALQKQQVNTNSPAEIKTIQEKIKWLNLEIDTMREYGQTAEQFFGMSKKQLDRLQVSTMPVKGANKQIALSGPSTKDMGLSTPQWLTDFDKNTQALKDKFSQFTKDLNASINNFISGGITNIAEGIGNMIGGDKSNIGDLFNTLLKTVGGFLKQLGGMFIAFGVGMDAFKESIKKLDPYVAIAAGIGMIIAGSVLTSFASKGPKGFANGGIVSGSSFSGDLVNARVNSGEMILNGGQQKQLFAMANGSGMSGNWQDVKHIVEVEIRGDKLVAVIEMYNRKFKNRK